MGEPQYRQEMQWIPSQDIQRRLLHPRFTRRLRSLRFRNVEVRSERVRSLLQAVIKSLQELERLQRLLHSAGIHKIEMNIKNCLSNCTIKEEGCQQE